MRGWKRDRTANFVHPRLHRLGRMRSKARALLLVEPDVFHARAIGDAVDHYRQTLHLRLPAGRAAIVKDDRSGAVLRQFPLALPH